MPSQQRFYATSLVFLALFMGLGCGKPKPEEMVTKVGGEPISVYDLTQLFFREGEKFGLEANGSSKQFRNAKEKLLEELIQRKILLKEAKRQGIAVSDQELADEIKKYKANYSEANFQKVLEERKINYENWKEVKRQNLIINRLVQKQFSDLKIPEEKMKEYYDQHLKEFTSPEAVHIRHIVTDSKEKAELILKKIKEGDNFARLARDLSIAPDRFQGGDVGFILRGSFPKEFDICFDLKVGEISSIISSLYGFHIFKVLEKRAEKIFSYEEVKGQIEEWLQAQAREEAFQNYYQALRKQTPVEVKSWVLRRIQF